MKIYAVMHTYGCYSDYTEQVVGVSNDWNQAAQFAKQFSRDFNTGFGIDGPRYTDGDVVLIRSYEADKYLLNPSKAEVEAYGLEDSAKIVYELNEQGKLVDVEVDK